jgi:tetratricopeptide (TPR) repeat protein
MELALAEDPASDPLATGHALVQLGSTLQLLDGSEVALVPLNRALVLAEQVGDVGLRARVARCQANAFARMGELRRAADLCVDSLAAADEAGDVDEALLILHTLALAHRALGEHREGVAVARELIERAGAAGQIRAEAQGLATLANLHADVLEPEIEEELQMRALAGFRLVGDRRHEALALGNLAGISFQAGRLDEAAERIEAAIVSLEALGDRRSAALNRMNLGSVHEKRDHPVPARTAYRAAAAVLDDLSDTELSWCLIALTRAERLCGAHARVRAEVLERAAAAPGADSPVHLVNWYCERVHIDLELGLSPTASLAAMEETLTLLSAVPGYVQVPVDDARAAVARQLG